MMSMLDYAKRLLKQSLQPTAQELCRPEPDAIATKWRFTEEQRCQLAISHQGHSRDSYILAHQHMGETRKKDLACMLQAIAASFAHDAMGWQGMLDDKRYPVAGSASVVRAEMEAVTYG